MATIYSESPVGLYLLCIIIDTSIIVETDNDQKKKSSSPATLAAVTAAELSTMPTDSATAEMIKDERSVKSGLNVYSIRIEVKQVA